MSEDRYANLAGIAVTESGPGVLTFTEKLTSVGLGTGKAMLIDQIDYFVVSDAVDDLVAVGDRIDMGITLSSGVTDLQDVTDSRILHSFQLAYHMASSVGFQVLHMPIRNQFFPSLITAHQRIYLACIGISLAAVITVRARIYWRYVDITDRNMAELVQATLLQG